MGRPLADACIALLGLAFKPDTDDTRDSPAITLARVLRERSARVVACDPQAGGVIAEREPWIEVVPDPLEAARDADALVLATEWPSYVTADLAPLAAVMRGNVLFDGRNALDPTRVEAAGLTYVAVGGGATTPSSGSLLWRAED